MITVYSQPGCQPCNATKRALDRAGLDFREVDVTASPESLSYVKSLGYAATPVVVVERGDSVEYWSGYRPDLIRAQARIKDSVDVRPQSPNDVRRQLDRRLEVRSPKRTSPPPIPRRMNQAR